MSYKIFYNTVNGIKDGEHAIKEDGEVYRFLLENYHICEDIDGNEELIIDENILNDIINSNRGFTDAENILLGFMLFHMDYVGAFVFKTFEEGE